MLLSSLQIYVIPEYFQFIFDKISSLMDLENVIEYIYLAFINRSDPRRNIQYSIMYRNS